MLPATTPACSSGGSGETACIAMSGSGFARLDHVA
jgi:hypothetical protein